MRWGGGGVLMPLGSRGLILGSQVMMHRIKVRRKSTDVGERN